MKVGDCVIEGPMYSGSRLGIIIAHDARNESVIIKWLTPAQALFFLGTYYYSVADLKYDICIGEASTFEKLLLEIPDEV